MRNIHTLNLFQDYNYQFNAHLVLKIDIVDRDNDSYLIELLILLNLLI